jgi:hypothetical protein
MAQSSIPSSSLIVERMLAKYGVSLEHVELPGLHLAFIDSATKGRFVGRGGDAKAATRAALACFLRTLE